MKRLLFCMLSLMCIQLVYAQAPTKPKRESIEWLDIWAPNTNDKGLPRVLLIGNSITRLYNPIVERLLKGKAYVARLTTSKSVGDPALLDEISMFMRQYSFDVVHFNNGMHGWAYSEEEYRRAFPKFFETIKKYAPHATLIWATTTPRRKGKGMLQIDSLTNRIKERNRIATEYLSKKSGVIIDDLYSVISSNPAYYENGDGTHPNAVGVKVLADKVTEIISETLDKRSKSTH
jgi:lysophospholipase L1-like esterase